MLSIFLIELSTHHFNDQLSRIHLLLLLALLSEDFLSALSLSNAVSLLFQARIFLLEFKQLLVQVVRTVTIRRVYWSFPSEILRIRTVVSISLS